jgi:CheY-like chemotaxis protein
LAETARITVVNDTETFLDLIRDALHDRYVVTTFDGRNMTPERLKGSRPDLLMIDLVLRGRTLSGWEVVQMCRADDQLSKLPIIVCSADWKQLRDRAGELAAIPSLTVLEKPFGLHQLEATIESALEPRAADGQAAGY